MASSADDNPPATTESSAPPPSPPTPRRNARRTQDRVTLHVIRGVFFLTASGIGVYAARLFFEVPQESPYARYLTIVGACVIAMVVIAGEVFFSKASIRILSSICFGLIMGFILSLLFQPVVELVVNAISGQNLSAEEHSRISGFLHLVTASLFCYYGISVLLQTKDDFKFIIPYVEFRKDVKGYSPFIVDTSVLIDGRIRPLLETGILDRRLVIPRFVLNELQAIADSGDRGRRERGRRGMDILHDLRREGAVEITELDRQSGRDVDQELIFVAEDLGGKLLTTDFNLQKRARLQGIPVVNVNNLATALKPSFVPGDTARIKLLRDGDAEGQAVGFLPDGTMVVVENASRKVGQEVTVEVTSVTQTSAGKMLFGRLKRSARRSRRESRGSSVPRTESVSSDIG